MSSAPLSPLAEAAIRLLPGNDRCADCKAIYPQWAGVSFGVLLCLACAGKHRALGVSVSFVKSLGMDSWSPAEQRALEIGGNAKWAAVCTGTGTFDLPPAHKYSSSVAKAYKHRIMVMANASKPFNNGLTANEFLAQLLQSASTPASPDDVAALRASILDSSPRESSSDDSRSSSVELPTDAKEEYQEPVTETRSRRVYSTDLAVKCTTCGGEIPLNDIDSHSKRCVVRSSGTVTWRKYDCKFGRPGESLGFSLTKTKGGFAEITRVAPGGEADKAGVLVGSYIVGLNEHRLSEFEDIVTLVSSLERPIHFHFVHRTLLGSSLSGTSGFGASQRLSGVLSSISSVPEPVTVETEVVFDHNVREIGCVLQVQNGRCIVTAVDDGSAAQKQGVLVGSCISAVNGRHVLRGNEAINMIQKSARPLRIKFHRVEGLMRGWKSS